MSRGRVLGVVTSALVLVPLLGACAVNQLLPAPDCVDGGSSLIAAQSVPTASQVPCLEPLPNGWSVSSVEIDEHHTVVRLDSDRAGDDAATLRLELECDVASAVSAPSEFPGAERFDRIDRLDPGFRGSRFYVFPGGCVTWTFDFDNDASATESVAIGDTLTLIARTSLNDNIRATFIDEDI